MFGGKTEELLRQLRRYEYAKKHVVTIKHVIDNRVDVNVINSHAGRTRQALPAHDEKSLCRYIKEGVEVIAIDEIQFFPEGAVRAIDKMINAGITVVVAGIDTTFRGEPFGIVPTLLAKADDVIKLKGICVICGEDARHTQRMVNGQPAEWNSPTILVGGQDSYESRCRNCFSIEKEAAHTLATESSTVCP